ncbi:uncharacterized protein LOC125179384 [Hyalella azteca]|uniref:Uncharacterized protein LOC125179384 n=1 Tax=Hyalella azteca TaxID=294128 RepID=A0A979FV50_HYAAZ|nr:uncharacterized protein LOC125179384 [Hyalella azteca]
MNHPSRRRRRNLDFRSENYKRKLGFDQSHPDLIPGKSFPKSFPGPTKNKMDPQFDANRRKIFPSTEKYQGPNLDSLTKKRTITKRYTSIAGRQSELNQFQEDQFPPYVNPGLESISSSSSAALSLSPGTGLSLRQQPSIYQTSQFPATSAGLDIIRPSAGRSVVMSGVDGLRWTAKPPRKVLFSNSSGGMVDCAVDGSQLPVSIQWAFEDGRSVVPVPGLLTVRVNGSLEFLPFAPPRLDPLLHDATYVCVVRSTVGVLTSLPVTVRADGKYHVTSAGILHVLSVTEADTRAAFQCRTLNMQRVLLTILVLREWFRGLVPVDPDGSGTWMVGGSLVIPSAQVPDSGEYRCVVNNSAGTVTMRTKLTVTAPLRVQMHQSSIELTVGQPLRLRCSVTGFPQTQIVWYKDSVLLRDDVRISIAHSKDVSRTPSISSASTGSLPEFSSTGSELSYGMSYPATGSSSYSFRGSLEWGESGQSELSVSSVQAADAGSPGHLR